MQGTSPLKVKVILGSTRQGRFGDKPGNWIFDEAKNLKEMDVELLDLRDYPMPFFNEPVSPSMAGGKYNHDVVKKWAAKIKEADAFIIVTPEYNHGYPGVLKNAMDSIFPEWNKKPVGFVAYGSAGGARSVEQLREVAIELQMMPIRNAIHIPPIVYMAIMNEKVPVNPDLFKPIREPMDRVKAFFDELVWAGKALRAAREEDASK